MEFSNLKPDSALRLALVTLENEPDLAKNMLASIFKTDLPLNIEPDLIELISIMNEKAVKKYLHEINLHKLSKMLTAHFYSSPNFDLLLCNVMLEKLESLPQLFVSLRYGNIKDRIKTLFGWFYVENGQTVKGIEYLEEEIENLRTKREPSALAHALYHLGSAYIQMLQNEKALESLLEAKKILERIDPKGKLLEFVSNALKIQNDLEHGTFLPELSISEAKEIFQELTDEDEKESFPALLSFESFASLGLACFSKGEYDISLENFVKAVQVSREIIQRDKNFLPRLAGTLYLLGGVYTARGDKEKAIESFTESRKILQKVGLSSQYLLIQALNLMLLEAAYNDKKMLDSANECQAELWKTFENFDLNKEIDKVTADKTFSILCTHYISNGRFDVAEKCFTESNKIYEKLDKNSGAKKVQLKAAVSKLINTLSETIKANPFEQFPYSFADTQTKIGFTYYILARLESKVENFEKATEAYKEALKVYTIDKFPIEHVNTQDNLGNVYYFLAQTEDKNTKLTKAIAAYSEELSVYTFEKYPVDYAIVQINIGNSYYLLGQVEDKVENCKKAINAYINALRIYSLDQFPLNYAVAQINIGNTYNLLAEMESKRKNSIEAITAYSEAFKIYTFDKFPMKFAEVQFGLGISYFLLSEVEDKVENCKTSNQCTQRST